MTAVGGQVLVAGIGNVFRSDDGFGPEVARRLAAAEAPRAEVRVVDYGVRGLHLAYDLLEPVRALVLVDTVPGPGEPGTLHVLQVGPEDVRSSGVGLSTHGMDPAVVLATLRGLGGEVPPTYVVGCVPADVSDGLGLTAPVAAAVGPAVERVQHVLTELTPTA